ncbi:MULTISPECIES: DUF3325 domain-containing protein [unclassified Acinetobacter]|uniref:DUF3325 domain-containing protein n=1 Tax=unclassified Acinetobacter TaxID=196816 RepID=UPI00293437B7|nr:MULTISPECIES: DUF3325 domain-containing protein [unclassified Acinetobacter]WOE31509.1 DUF3325 domain-containing protein [Acinetobacter sp. SAAs470]WOE39705.1 DUF3325 domain-containing protein [Acinetobacter sp. SAAs474]
MNILSIHILIALLLSYIGLFALNLTMERNAKLILKQPLSIKKNQMIKVLGWMCLVFSLFNSIWAWGGPIGITAWFGVITVIAGVIVFIQSYRARLNLNLSIIAFFVVIGLQVLRW